MDAPARNALRIIQDCLHSGRYRVLSHFIKRLDLRGRFWLDIQAVIVSAQAVNDEGVDRFGREKWRICGQTTDRMALETVCALDRDEQGNWTVFITAYWQ